MGHVLEIGGCRTFSPGFDAWRQACTRFLLSLAAFLWKVPAQSHAGQIPRTRGSFLRCGDFLVPAICYCAYRLQYLRELSRGSLASHPCVGLGRSSCCKATRAVIARSHEVDVLLQRRPSILHATAQQPKAHGQCFESLGRHLMSDFSSVMQLCSSFLSCEAVRV